MFKNFEIYIALAALIFFASLLFHSSRPKRSPSKALRSSLMVFCPIAGSYTVVEFFAAMDNVSILNIDTELIIMGSLIGAVSGLLFIFWCLRRIKRNVAKKYSGVNE